MPALQVRDFPDDLYEQLKDYAASQHRSIAQQTIVAVEQMLEEKASQRRAEEQPYLITPRARIFEYDSEAARVARIKKRKELFARIEANKTKFPDDMPSAVEIIHKGRRERDRQISDILGLPYDEEALA